MVGIALVAWLAWRRRAPDATRATAQASFVGAAACASCHRQEHDAWKGSQHALAMQPATERSVLGDFRDAAFTNEKVTSTFRRERDGYWVRTDGPDGRLADFKVKYTFGVDPLQQYLIEMPDGRVQALSIAWDARPRERGGQRWFHLYPGQGIEHTSELHWSGLQQNWNFMCADCHSTNVRKGYDAASNRFATTWSEIDVSCEACHGPASRHVSWARKPRWLTALLSTDHGLGAPLGERRGVTWSIDSVTGTARRSAPPGARSEMETCAPCHSRRVQVAGEYTAGRKLYDHYVPSLLMPGLYHADGQQRDEVYTYASFAQSRMYHAGVTCADCHDPHTQRLRAEGNALCARCHAAGRFDTPAHTFHRAGSDGSRCVSCHMPATTYMQIDARRDHSLRVPRPDLSVSLGVPNACTGCHTDRSAQWAAEVVRARLGRDARGFQRFAEAFHADESGAPGADSALQVVFADSTQPAIVRATALARMAGHADGAALAAARAGAQDADPAVRLAALGVIEAVPAEQRSVLAAPLLRDPRRAVRGQAAWVLAPAAASLGEDDARAFARASDEFVAGQRLSADRPEARITLGTYFGFLGRLPEAEAEYRAALRLFSRAVPAYLNLADLYRAQGREAEAARTLQQGLAVAPEDPALHSALGMAHARAGRITESVAELGRAASLGRRADYDYAYAVALNSAGRGRDAIRVLDAALARSPGDRDLLFALATFHRDAGDRTEARRAAERLVAAHPADAEARALLQSLVVDAR
jgi:predicted CXXCH cytochrome family protein